MESYLKEISKISLLTPEEEHQIAIKAHKGDSRAREELITRNLRFVVDVAKSYQGQGLSLEELIAEGNVGICKAADRFDPYRGMKFITYAVWWIRQGILQALSENTRLIRIPINRINQLQRSKKEYERRLQTNEGMANIDDYDIDSQTMEIYHASSLRLSDETKSEQIVGEMIEDENIKSPDHDLHNESLKIDFETLFESLTEREIEILKYYHGIDEFRNFTLEEIGNIVGLTRERVRQIKKKSLKKIRGNPQIKSLIKYL